MPMHSRQWNVKHYDDLDELAETITQTTWTLCTGFEIGGATFLNDATSEDGAQEYAVVKGGVQVESFTCSWMTAEQFATAAQSVIDGEPEEMVSYGPVNTTPHVEGPCAYCA